MPSPESVVSTKPHINIKHLISQRIRWGSKWRIHKDIATRLLAFFIFLFQLSMLVLPIAVGFNWLTLSLAGLILAGKFIVEYIFLKSVAQFLSVRWSWMAFVTLQVIYPVYAVTIGILSNFVHPTWKERRI